ncbi:hypothetical protein JN11_01016 [Mucilaginibacter frigoritolerans]|uniref:Uncharacterized protein n=2 Tax=Mucilaginibacter frigoritolerans TaxID=652788 RepID=A0A562UCC6_9SPHI|nr:hypothetical protein JN11_01016 [Mucilaginibacter frigoritolerans]
MWESISFEELKELISEGEAALESGNYEKEVLVFWKHIKINPEKWKDENGYAKERDGFFVVAILGKRVIWYNDIEEGFNLSFYDEYGIIRDYWCDQYELNQAVYQFYHSINNDFLSRSGPPEPLSAE